MLLIRTLCISHAVCLVLFRKSFRTEKPLNEPAFRIFLAAGQQPLDGWQMPGSVRRWAGPATVCVWYQLAGTGSGGSENVLLGAHGRIPAGEKKN